jgi:hypothetical protein
MERLETKTPILNGMLFKPTLPFQSVSFVST